MAKGCIKHKNLCCSFFQNSHDIWWVSHEKNQKKIVGILKKKKTHHHNGHSTFKNVLGTMDENISL
jgi:hypothetical protein